MISNNDAQTEQKVTSKRTPPFRTEADVIGQDFGRTDCQEIETSNYVPTMSVTRIAQWNRSISSNQFSPAIFMVPRPWQQILHLVFPFAGPWRIDIRIAQSGFDARRVGLFRSVR
jgi:hypothetical protein